MARHMWLAAALSAVMLAAGGASAQPAADFGIGAFVAAKDKAGLRSSATADLGGALIYYETYGAGPPVLVLHGGSAWLETMHWQIEALAKDHLVIAPDSRGHGRSTDGGGPLHYARMAEDMISLMDRLHIRKADIVGWSDGGIIGLHLAIHHPERVGRLVTLGANFDLTGIDLSRAPPAADSPAVAPQRDAYRRLSPTPDQWPVFYDKVQTMWRTEPNYTAKELGRIRSPVLVMAGEADSIPRAHTEALARAISGARQLIVAGATHFAPLTHPAQVNAPIVAFLSGAP